MPYLSKIFLVSDAHKHKLSFTILVKYFAVSNYTTFHHFENSTHSSFLNIRTCNTFWSSDSSQSTPITCYCVNGRPTVQTARKNAQDACISNAYH